METAITLKSGAILELKMAPFSSGMKLFKTIANELKGVDVELGGLDLKEIGSKDINSLKNVIFQLLGSDAIEACFFDCAKHSLHEGQKISRLTFEPENARGDYLPVAWEVIKFNIAPFFSGLDLSSLTKSKPKPSGQP
jgi:hypothetical protein